MRSPTTPMRLPRRRGTSRLRRAADWARSVVEVDMICRSLAYFTRGARSVWRFGGLVNNQNWNLVANRVNAAAGVALEAIGRIDERTKRRLALRADKDVEEVFGDQHEGSVVESRL